MLLITALCLSLSAAPQTGESQDAKTAQKAIQKVLQDQVDCWNKGDLKGFMAGYQRTADITFYSGDKVVKGWDDMLERYQKRYQAEGKEMGKLAFSELDIQVLSPDSALVRGRWQLKLSKSDPGGLFTLLLRKTDDGWRIIHDHTSERAMQP
jgi:beta-aspartyl-peptidase (threonine type)